MSTIELTSVLNELQELKRMREELDAELTALEDKIKAEMGDRETLTAGPYRVTWKPVTSSRLDGTALRRELPEIAARYSKQTTVRRFCIN